MARVGHIVHWLARIVNDQGVGSRQQRHRCGGIFACIPGDASSLLDTHIVGYGVGGIIQAAGGDDIDCGWSDGERGVVPSESHKLADLVVGGGEGARSDHGDTAGGETRINGNSGRRI